MISKLKERNWVNRNKLFEHNFEEFPDLPTVTINGKRHYVTPEGEKFVSVTSVLSHGKDMTSLNEWRARVGHEEADRISKRALTRGNAVHLLAEEYVRNMEILKSDHQPINLMLFEQIKKVLDQRVDNIRCIEDVLISHKFRVAGRVDLIADLDGQRAIIDYKNSDKPKSKEWITDYFKQASLYAYMYWEMTGIPIKKIAIIIALEEENDAQLFVESPAKYIESVAETIRSYHKEKGTL